MQFIPTSILSVLNIMSFYADLPIDLPGFEIFSALWRFEGCFEVSGWIIGKRKMKAVSSQPDLFLGVVYKKNFFCTLPPTFSPAQLLIIILKVVLLIKDSAEYHLIKLGCQHDDTSDFGSDNDPTLTRHCATFPPVTPIFISLQQNMSSGTWAQNLKRIYLVICLPRPRYHKALSDYDFIGFAIFRWPRGFTDNWAKFRNSASVRRAGVIWGGWKQYPPPPH